MHANVAHEIEEIEVAEPIRIVRKNGGILSLKGHKARHLLLEAGGVVIQFFTRHHPAHIRFAGRVADGGRAAAKEHDGPVPAALHVRHGHEGNIMADVQAVRSRIEADIKSDTLLSQ